MIRNRDFLGSRPIERRGLLNFQIGGEASVVINFQTDGIFSRSTSGSYYISPTIYSGQILSDIAWAPPNQRRFENGMLLIEGSRTNILTEARNANVAFFNGPASNTTLTGAQIGADGLANATRFDAAVIPLNGYCKYPSGAKHTISSSVSIYFKGITSSLNSIITYTSQLGAAYDGSFVATGTIPANQFVRISRQGGPAEIIGWRWFGGAISVPPSTILDFWQIESGSHFPSSPIWSSGTAGTRAADSLILNTIPLVVSSGSFQFDIEPMFSSDESISSSNDLSARYTLLSMGDNDFVQISGSKILVSASVGLGNAFSSSNLIWSRYRRMRVIINARDGYVDISGANSGNGRSNAANGFAFGGTQLRVGAISGSGNHPYFGRISNISISGAI